MAVYVDDAFIPAKVGRHESKWCHLIADSEEELHEFAARLGLRRSYFQEGTLRGDGTKSPHWHYDVTEGKRWQAVKLGAQEIGWRDAPGIIRAREAGARAREQAATGREPGKEPKRILVTGSRTWTDEAVIETALKALYEPGAILVSGHCKDGADAIAERVWESFGGTVERHPADWKAHGKSAGFKRNDEMVATTPHGGVAFIKDQSPGATHTAGLAKDAGISMDIHTAETAREERIAQLDRDAGFAYKSCEYLRAARLIEQARELYPEEPDLWAKRAEAIHDAMRKANEPTQEHDRPLEEIATERLAAAGVQPGDPDMTYVRDWNAKRLASERPAIDEHAAKAAAIQAQNQAPAMPAQGTEREAI